MTNVIQYFYRTIPELGQHLLGVWVGHLNGLGASWLSRFWPLVLARQSLLRWTISENHRIIRNWDVHGLLPERLSQDRLVLLRHSCWRLGKRRTHRLDQARSLILGSWLPRHQSPAERHLLILLVAFLIWFLRLGNNLRSLIILTHHEGVHGWPLVVLVELCSWLLRLLLAILLHKILVRRTKAPAIQLLLIPLLLIFRWLLVVNLGGLHTRIDGTRGLTTWLPVRVQPRRALII